MTEDKVATLDSLIHYWGKASQVCGFNIPDMVLPSDAEYLMLTLYVKASKDPSILGAQSMSLQHTKVSRGKHFVRLYFGGLSCHIFFKDAITEGARPIHLLISDTH